MPGIFLEDFLGTFTHKNAGEQLRRHSAQPDGDRWGVLCTALVKLELGFKGIFSNLPPERGRKIGAARKLSTNIFQQTRVYPYPLGAGSARPNPKMGAPDPEIPLFLGFAVLRGRLRPMVSEGARPWGRGRSGDCEFWTLSDIFDVLCPAQKMPKLSNNILTMFDVFCPARKMTKVSKRLGGGQTCNN